DLQQQLTESRNQALSAHSQVNVTVEAVASMRKRQAQLRDLRQAEGWDDLDEKICADQENAERLRNEITTAAGEEGLSISLLLPPVTLDMEDAPSSPSTSMPSDGQLRTPIEEAIKSTEHEIAALDAKMDALP